MYIHHHRGIMPPPIPWGGGCGNTGHGTIYMYLYGDVLFLRLGRYFGVTSVTSF